MTLEVASSTSILQGQTAPATLTVAVTGPLGIPIPDGSSDQYASGWARADVAVAEGLCVEVGDGWDEAKVQGYRDRLDAEFGRQGSKHVQPATG